MDETYHLFIQALSERNEEAWDEIQKQFNYLVKKWIRNQIFMITPAEIEDLAQITFFKFWNILSKQKGELTKNFPFCGAIVKYLKRCAETTAIEHLRKQQRLNHLDEKLKQSNQFAYELQSRQQFEGLSEQSNLVRRWVTTNINHPDERLLLKLLFEYDMKPREIVNKFPSKFPTKRDVYRLREKIVKRARRNKQLNSYYSS
ncbi:MAG: hypothetical protein AAF490_13960 [Chloroflexota bacterium]